MASIESNSLLIQVSAFSGLIGALLTQGLTGLFSYVGDKRKANTELKSTFRNKQIDIAENFYFVTGEKMSIVKKNISYWKNYNNSRSEASLDFLGQEIKKLNAYIDKLDAENWKYNLIGLYFNVSLTNEAVIASNAKSKELYLLVLDLTDGIKHALKEEKNDLYELHNKAVVEMCNHYEHVYQKMCDDMMIVKSQLTKEFSF
ncbi:MULTISPECIES: hypothetical protein [unclassified Mucilaginibacter]|uniref:hypothetical protein n=1 Tax=unclassified Mucilaginibacter TaxID=2617802 RepID=UPI00339721A8